MADLTCGLNLWGLTHLLVLDVRETCELTMHTHFDPTSTWRRCSRSRRRAMQMTTWSPVT
ncbi:hypothetical protein AB0469_40300 [Streptomyces sp. NPDC093801]|uniref:hypothetical protein n=1 Tax=Streptomyces sp. NPDC093801 TaxID=3155203 RepID=UPI00344FA5FB